MKTPALPARVQVLSRAPPDDEQNAKRVEKDLSINLSRDAALALAAAADALNKVASAMLGRPATAGTALPPDPAGNAGASVADVINDFLVAKLSAGKSDRYVRALRNSLSKFAVGRSRQPLDRVMTEDIEAWLNESRWAPRTQNGYLLDVRTLYNFAVRRGYCQSNPANHVEERTELARDIGIHTPDEVQTVMNLARHHDLNIMRCMALRYFAGLRAVEAENQREEDIHRKEGIIIVTRAKRNTRRRRPVTIQPVLAHWLDAGGSLPLHDVSNRMGEFLKLVKAVVPWPHNAPRHSFCSYHLAMWKNAARTAYESGHSEQMLFSQYRAITFADGKLLTKDEAARFWRCVPAVSVKPVS